MRFLKKDFRNLFTLGGLSVTSKVKKIDIYNQENRIKGRNMRQHDFTQLGRDSMKAATQAEQEILSRKLYLR